LSLIQELSQDRYEVSWNEAAEQEPNFKKDLALRARYAEIPCKRGVLYQFSDDEVAWRLGNGSPPEAKYLRRLLRNKPEWLHISVSCMSASGADNDGAAFEKDLKAQGLEYIRPDEDEAILYFHRDHFTEVAKLAGARKRRGRKHLSLDERVAAARNLLKAVKKNSLRNDSVTPLKSMAENI